MSSGIQRNYQSDRPDRGDRAGMSSMSSKGFGAGLSAGEERSRRKPRADGEESRREILLAAAKLATTRGLEGLSIGELAEHVGMSKSGLYAHFKSKEELELATIETAAGIFERDVLGPASESPGGLGRVLALSEAFLRTPGTAGLPGRLLLRDRLGAARRTPRAPTRPGDGVVAEAAGSKSSPGRWMRPSPGVSYRATPTSTRWSSRSPRCWSGRTSPGS